MTHIAYFGHDSADAAIRRRVQAFHSDGFDVTGFMMHRRDPGALPWENIDLGETRDGAFVQRFKSIFSGADIAARHAEFSFQAALPGCAGSGGFYPDDLGTVAGDLSAGDAALYLAHRLVPYRLSTDVLGGFALLHGARQSRLPDRACH